jgi:peptide/nickel transport system substrate-binding protein
MADNKEFSLQSVITKSLLIVVGLVISGCFQNTSRENKLPGNGNLSGIDGSSIENYSNAHIAYHEAPMLSKRVEAGTLPPIQERLPKNPFVRKVETIGKYGGTLYDDAESQGGRFFLDGALTVAPQETDNDGKNIMPHICEKVEHNADYSEFTFYIREGLRWSDGVEFTADDIIWWWENEQNNKDLYPEGPRNTWKTGDKYAVFEKISKWVFKISFEGPFRPLINMSAHEFMGFSNFFGQPAHYMKQFHIDFNPKANELAKSYGYEYWFQLYKEREEYMRPHEGKPNLSPWIRVSTGTTHDIYERNPYFAEVDQDGNQLPYIDRIYVSVVEDRKLREARVATGGVSIGQTILSQISIYKKNEEKADFTIKKWKLSNSSECMFAFNLNHKDSIYRKIYNDLRFRKAMSLAINRKKINETLYFGLAKECQATVNPNVSFYDPEWQKYYAGYNVDEANALLDEIGLKWDQNKEYRLLPDGRRLRTVVIYTLQTFQIQLMELVRQDWSKIGMDVILKESDQQFRQQRCKSGEHDCTCWNADLVEETAIYLPWVTKWNPNNSLFYAMDWWYWFYSEGKNGIEPPEIWKEQFNRMAKWYHAKNDEEYRKYGYNVWDFFTKQLVCIGTVGYAPMPVVVKNGLKNVKETISMGYGTVWAKSYLVQTFFWDNPEKHK